MFSFPFPESHAGIRGLFPNSASFFDPILLKCKWHRSSPPSSSSCKKNKNESISRILPTGVPGVLTTLFLRKETVLLFHGGEITMFPSAGKPIKYFLFIFSSEKKRFHLSFRFFPQFFIVILNQCSDALGESELLLGELP